MDITKYNFPEGTTAELKNSNGELLYVISYESSNKTETVFGLIPEKQFSTGNSSLEDAVNTFEMSLQANGFQKINNIWQ